MVSLNIYTNWTKKNGGMTFQSFKKWSQNILRNIDMNNYAKLVDDVIAS